MVKAEFIGISSFGSPLRRSLRGLRLRTEMTLRGIPVFRSAYSASRNARAPAASRPPPAHRNDPSGHSGVSVGLFSEKAIRPFLQNARPSGSLRSPSGGRGKLRSPLHPSLLPPEMRRQTGGNPPLREKLSFGARHGFPFRSAYPQKAWSFLRTPPRPAAKRAASTRAATPLPPPASSFFLTARSSFRTSRRP